MRRVLPVLITLLSVSFTQAVQACSTPRNAAQLRAEAVRLVNAERQRRGLPQFTVSSKLQRAAERHACDMARNGLRSHTGSDGSNFARRYRRAGGCGAGGENIAWGQRSAASVVQMWIESSGHRANILHRRAVSIGVYVTDGNGTPNWVMVVGRGC